EAGVAGTVALKRSPRGLQFARIASGPQEIMYEGDGSQDAAWLLLHVEGRATIRAGGTSMKLAPRDLIYAPSGLAVRVSLQSNFRQFFIRIPYDVVGRRLITPLSPKLTHLGGAAGLDLIFTGLLGTVADTLETMTADDLRPVEIALVEF